MLQSKYYQFLNSRIKTRLLLLLLLRCLSYQILGNLSVVLVTWMGCEENWLGLLRPHLHGLEYPRQPSPRVTQGEVTFRLFLSKNSTNHLH